MYKIGEFSKITQMTIKTLRYYDEIGLLSPAYVETSTNYRYYDEKNYEKATVIRMLKRYEFTIAELLEVVPKIENHEDLSVFLLEKHEQISQQIKASRHLQKEMLKEATIIKEMNNMNILNTVEIKEVPAIQIASIRYKGKYEDVGIYIGKLFKVVGMHAVGAPFCLYYDEEYTEVDADIEVCVEVKKKVSKGEIETRMLPKQKCMSYIQVGPYTRISEGYKKVMDYMIENNIEGSIPSREIYIKGPGMLMKGNPEKYETEILIPIVQ